VCPARLGDRFFSNWWVEVEGAILLLTAHRALLTYRGDWQWQR
jgi:hypothetical protein